MRYAHVVEEPLGLYQIFGKIAIGCGRKDRGPDEEHHNTPAHHQLIGNYSCGVTNYVEEAVDVLSLPSFPCTVGGVVWSGVIVTGGKRVQLLHEPVIRVDLRSLYSAQN